jgi:hypothetical protein
MRLFYKAFPLCDALRHELSWTHYRRLLRVDSDNARLWYMDDSATQNWSGRVSFLACRWIESGQLEERLHRAP